jgi:thioredoxin-like negative regulator of GroEL
MSKIVLYAFLCILSLSAPTSAISGEVAPGISIKHKTYDIPKNEQPYYGFAPKSQFLVDLDKQFIEGALKKYGGDRKAAAKAYIAQGWQFMNEKNDVKRAAERFNQAWLLDPGQSEIAHGFALIVYLRFEDADYANELMNLAGKLDDPVRALPTSHAGLLMDAKRPKEAIPFFQKAIEQNKDARLAGLLHLHLAGAYVADRQSGLACETLKKVENTLSDKKLRDYLSDKQKKDYEEFKQAANCP